MYSNTGKGIANLTLLLPFLLFRLNQVQANEVNISTVEVNRNVTSLTVMPEQCVTIRQGRDCFATVQLQWQSDSKHSFCLYQEGTEKQLGCWQDNNSISVQLEFESNKSVKYQLRNQHNDKVIAETKVEVSWQHRKISRKRRWRLF
jgi:hypothetical protein